jgi:hypothetical protein
MLARAQELGYGHRDIAALYEVLARTPGDATGAPGSDAPATGSSGEAA